MKLYAIVMLTIGAMVIAAMGQKTEFKITPVFRLASIEVVK